MKDILQPPVKPATACLADKRLLTSAEGYLNRYRNGWAASAAAVKSWVDEAVRRRGKPVGGQAPVPLNELPVPVPISRLLWPFVSPCSQESAQEQSVTSSMISTPKGWCFLSASTIVTV